MTIYLDHNATTPLAPEVLDAMMPFLRDTFGNASSVYSLGREARKAVEDSREVVAGILGASDKDCICFTGSGCEADNMAIKGVAYALRRKGNHIVTSAIEHHAVLNACKFLEEEGFEVTYVKPDANGRIHGEVVADALREGTILISIMHANNETGTINPIHEIGKIARERGILFHTDAVQSFCKIPFTADELKVDLLSLSAHKLYGPKGVGALYIRQGIPITPLINGGHHEGSRRAGTENVAGIAGLARAAQLCWSGLEDETRREKALSDKLKRGLQEKIPHIRLNGHPVQRLPNTLNLSFEFVEAESLVLHLDMQGVAVSSGSACTSDSREPSHVLLAMGVSHESARGSLRFSLGKENTEAEIDYVLDILPEIVEKMRSMSPLYTSRNGDSKKNRGSSVRSSEKSD
jgi:cysteine desulfurase